MKVQEALRNMHNKLLLIDRGYGESNLYLQAMEALSEIETSEPVRYEWFDEQTDEWIETSKTYYLQYSYDNPVRMLYTSPISKDWVTIHDDDINELSELAYKNGGWDIEFARAIEAKLKALNHDTK